MMWIIHPVFITTHCMLLFNVLAENHTHEKSQNTSRGDKDCEAVLHPYLYAYGIVCFLLFLVIILLIILFKKIISIQNGLRTRTDHMAINHTGESTALCQNEALSLSPLSGDVGDNSSSTTSSATPEGSLADLSSGSQRYVSLQDRSKTSDYINVSESALTGRVDFNNKIMSTDFENVNESRRKKINRKGKANCDDGTTSVSSDASSESAVNYSKVIFTKIKK